MQGRAGAGCAVLRMAARPLGATICNTGNRDASVDHFPGWPAADLCHLWHYCAMVRRLARSNMHGNAKPQHGSSCMRICSKQRLISKDSGACLIVLSAP